MNFTDVFRITENNIDVKGSLQNVQFNSYFAASITASNEGFV